jgi:hypothetical protein
VSGEGATCDAELRHTHGTAVCDLAAGHEGQHGAWCDICYENEYTDPSDRLSWDADGEDWITRKPATPA